MGYRPEVSKLLLFHLFYFLSLSWKIITYLLFYVFSSLIWKIITYLPFLGNDSVSIYWNVINHRNHDHHNVDINHREYATNM